MYYGNYTRITGVETFKTADGATYGCMAAYQNPCARPRLNVGSVCDAHPRWACSTIFIIIIFLLSFITPQRQHKKTYTKHWNHISEPHLLPWQRERRQINGRISWPATGTRSRVIVHRQWVTEWVEFNAPPHTILVISQAESVQPAINNKLTSKPTP